QGSVTGYFDFNTEASVIALQQESNLRADGIVNEATWKALLNGEALFTMPNRGAPGGRTGSVTRPSCPHVEKPLTALTPLGNIGATVSVHPTFWFYVPYQPKPSRPIEFELLNEEGNLVYKTRFFPTEIPGIINVQLPKTLPPLEEDRKYQWVFSFVCNPTNNSEYYTVNGWIDRVELSVELKNELKEAATPWEQLFFYAENNLWYDTLTTLAKLRQTYPNDEVIAADWSDLLSTQNVSLDKLILEPIVPCCTSKQ
ncbi:MAG: DUF928 domain-containing protein, partial [Spirulinaceae cyanobacterium]